MLSDAAPRRFEAVLFDLYDTLVWLDLDRSKPGRQEVAERFGVSLERFMEAWRRSVNDRMLGRGDLSQHVEATAAALGLRSDPSLVADFLAIERRRLEESVHLYESTVPVLQWLAREGYRLALVSNVSDTAAIPIDYLGLDRHFDELILSHEVGILKPDPAIYDLACRRLGVSPAQTMFVADGGFGELDSAHEMGIFSVLLEQDRQSKDFGFSRRYDVKIHDLWDIRKLLHPEQEAGR
jgi:HAD superfamily hydrolase (TIGR01509 family)